MSANQKLKFRITLNAYNHSLLANANAVIVDKIRKLDEIYETVSVIKGPIHLPTKKRYYSVLRSPHVDKDSHEQFEIRTHKWIIDLIVPNVNYINMLGLLDIPSGVKVSILVKEFV